MGGNAFNSDVIVRINREDIDATLHSVADNLPIDGLDFAYLKDNLMGSAGKQPTSGDLDIAIDEERFVLGQISNACRAYLGDEFVSYGGLKGGQLNTAWPIRGDADNGRIQIDFIAGNPTWLKFSHHSPGENSAYRGVYISTLLGVMAKMIKDYEAFDPDTGERTARVGLRFDLERGLKRQWQLQRRKGQGISKVDPDFWETNVKMPEGELPPRFSRIGYIDDPEAVVHILLPGITPKEIDTFEKLWAIALRHPKWVDRIEEMKERFMDAVNRSSAVKNTKDGKAPVPEIFQENSEK